MLPFSCFPFQLTCTSADTLVYDDQQDADDDEEGVEEDTMEGEIAPNAEEVSEEEASTKRASGS